MTSEKAASKRYLISTTNYSLTLKQCALILEEEFKSKGYSISTTVAPSFIFKIYCYFDKSAKSIQPYVGKYPKYDNNKFVNELEIQPTDFKKSILDMAYDLIEKGIVKKRF